MATVTVEDIEIEPSAVDREEAPLEQEATEPTQPPEEEEEVAERPPPPKAEKPTRKKKGYGKTTATRGGR